MRKRWWLLLLILLILFINTDKFWQTIYPIQYKSLIWDISEEFQQDPFLIAAIIKVESQYDKRRVSKKGAIGLMQLMPATAQWGAEINNITYTDIEELARPDLNIRIGTWYVQYLHKKYNERTPLVVASYNSGPTRVDNWLKDQVWDGTLDNIDQVPFGETRHYLQRIQHFYDIYKRIYQ
ncbi:lytic transglycosylase domain-containing protein [Desulfuribacillus stibiiarsenatis]|uniref:lytic transglycosylase domain-containing protein n=1 Tax=Desulfuribacillus stibiiarsenatis TaxID=1390249 RepID=UPI00159F2D7C|nr:lytic transglycosylase domain-containing protein [Desulfuribacillus stibiiarsenatis]